MFVLMSSRSGLKVGHLGGPLAKSAENLVNTRGHIFKAIIMNLAENVCLDDFRSSSKLGHLKSKFRSPDQIKGRPC